MILKKSKVHKAKNSLGRRQFDYSQLSDEEIIQKAEELKYSTRICECGCGKPLTVLAWRKDKYIRGHHGRIRKGWSEEVRKEKFGQTKGKKHYLFGKHMPKSTKRKLSKAQLGIPESSEAVAQRSENNRKVWAKYTPEEKAHRLAISCRSKEALEKNKLSRKTPNNSEISLLSILNGLFPNTYRYVGDFSLWIGGKNPDYISRDGKKLIEFYGERWHKPKDQVERIKFFKQHGYSCLVVWYKELRKGNREALKQKLINFQNSEILQAVPV